MDESFIITHEDLYLLVKKAAIFWEYGNIIAGENNEITCNGNKKTIEEGYWTFSMFKKEIESFGSVTLDSNKHNVTCSITSDSIMSLKNLGPLLGFSKDQTINANTKTTGGKQVDINNGLEYIEITCSLVKMPENINTDGKKSAVILTLPITSTQSLNGSVQHYFNIESRVPIDKDVINKIDFNVTKNVGKVLLDLYIM